MQDRLDRMERPKTRRRIPKGNRSVKAALNKGEAYSYATNGRAHMAIGRSGHVVKYPGRDAAVKAISDHNRH